MEALQSNTYPLLIIMHYFALPSLYRKELVQNKYIYGHCFAESFPVHQVIRPSVASEG
jgi:hypothetical protein